MNTQTQPPWYKEPYVWLVIALPASAILAGFYTLFLAINSYDGLVVDDYYKQGLAINKRIEKENNAKLFGLDPVLSISGKSIQIELKANSTFDYPKSIEVTLSHATRQGFDQTVTLIRINEAEYQASIEELVSGHWNVIMNQQNWRIHRSYYNY